MREALSKAVWLVARVGRLRWLLLIMLALVTSGIEMVGAVVVFTLLGLVSDPNGSIELPVIGDVRDIIDRPDDDLIRVFVLIAAGVFLLRELVRIANVYAEKRVTSNAGARLSEELVEGYVRMPYEVHLSRNSADFIRNGHQAVLEIEGRIYSHMFRIPANIVVAIGLAIVLFGIAPLGTSIVIAVLGTTSVVVLMFIQPRLKRVGTRAHMMNGETLRTLQQALSGVRDVKLLGRERYFSRSYSRSRFRLARTRYIRAALSQIPGSMMELALMGFILLVLVISTTSSADSTEAIPLLGLFAYAGLRLQPIIQNVVIGLNDLRYASAHLDAVTEDLRTIEGLPEPAPASEPLKLNRVLELRDVTFRYENADRDAVKDVSISVQRGEVLGICGPTGGGKSTLIDLIAGLVPPSSGSISVDGVPIADQLRGWQSTLGVVSQMVVLLDETLRRNIAFGVPDNQIDDEAVHEAIELAQLDEFIAELPNGLDTMVGELGARVSGGQRQRIAIARALYRRPTVLIFDEATSALDNVTEAALMEAIERLRGDHTILLVAHRLSTVQRADRVAFIEDGHVTGLGSYADLVEDHAGLREMDGSQLAESAQSRSDGSRIGD